MPHPLSDILPRASVLKILETTPAYSTFVALQSDVIFDSDSKGNQTIHVRRFKFDGYVKNSRAFKINHIIINEKSCE